MTGCAGQRYDKAIIAGPSLPDTGLFILPVKGAIALPYGSREDGISIKGIVLEPRGADAKVVAAKAGEVVFADEELRGYGKTLILQHADNFSTVYARNSKILVHPGERVQEGQVIALAGTRNARRVYFEIRKDSKAVDPALYLRNYRE